MRFRDCSCSGFLGRDKKESIRPGCDAAHDRDKIPQDAPGMTGRPWFTRKSGEQPFVQIADDHGEIMVGNAGESRPHPVVERVAGRTATCDS